MTDESTSPGLVQAAEGMLLGNRAPEHSMQEGQNMPPLTAHPHTDVRLASEGPHRGLEIGAHAAPLPAAAEIPVHSEHVPSASDGLSQFYGGSPQGPQYPEVEAPAAIQSEFQVIFSKPAHQQYSTHLL